MHHKGRKELYTILCMECSCGGAIDALYHFLTVTHRFRYPAATTRIKAARLPTAISAEAYTGPSGRNVTDAMPWIANSFADGI
jgi:hypothetical protein